MKHDIQIRFRIVKNSRIIEASFDERLSFKDNLRLLSEICDEEIGNAEIYDPVKRIFLDKEVPLSSFSIQYYVSFYLFT